MASSLFHVHSHTQHPGKKHIILKTTKTKTRTVFARKIYQKLSQTRGCSNKLQPSDEPKPLELDGKKLVAEEGRL
jgi:hypothetical protein